MSEENMERRKLKLIITSPGGNASKSALGYKLSIPTVWVKKMGISPEDRCIEVVFDGEKITITKLAEDAVQ